MRRGSAGRAIGAVFGAGLLAATQFVACGDDCDSPSDCELGEGCFDGVCVAVATGERCSIDLDCVVADVPGATAFCNGGQCQLRPERPVPPDPNPDAGAGDGGSGGADAGAGGACNPVDPTTCPAGETCEVDGADLVCVTAGSVPVGGDCSAERCVREGICLNVSTSTIADPRCYQACDGDNPCTAPETCDALQNFTFGICG